jgi:predicted site-specific integrase-resolvase
MIVSDHVKGNKGLAEYLSSSVITAKRYRKKFHLPVYRVTGKSIFFKKTDIKHLIEKRCHIEK